MRSTIYRSELTADSTSEDEVFAFSELARTMNSNRPSDLATLHRSFYPTLMRPQFLLTFVSQVISR